MSGVGYGYQGYNQVDPGMSSQSARDAQGQDDQNQYNMRSKLAQALMQPSQPANNPYGGLANAGNMIAGALAQRGLQGQQQQINQNQIARNNPVTSQLPGQTVQQGGGMPNINVNPGQIVSQTPNLPVNQGNFLSLFSQ